MRGTRRWRETSEGPGNERSRRGERCPAPSSTSHSEVELGVPWLARNYISLSEKQSSNKHIHQVSPTQRRQVQDERTRKDRYN